MTLHNIYIQYYGSITYGQSKQHQSRAKYSPPLWGQSFDLDDKIDSDNNSCEIICDNSDDLVFILFIMLHSL